MKLIFVLLSFLMCCHTTFSQQESDTTTLKKAFYKEDQFYAGVTYNLIGKLPNGLSQSGFSSGFHLGFIKDMPIKDDGTKAIGIGIGYSANSFNHNLLVNKDSSGNFVYSLLDNSSLTYSKNKLSMHLVEMPFEFRWRTSTASEYKFWRIYTGFKLGYIFASTTKYQGDLGSIKYSNINDFNNLQYGLTLSIGYNTWNGYIQYNLNPIFSSEVRLENASIDMNAIKIGLMFYMF